MRRNSFDSTFADQRRQELERMHSFRWIDEVAISPSRNAAHRKICFETDTKFAEVAYSYATLHVQHQLRPAHGREDRTFGQQDAGSASESLARPRRPFCRARLQQF